MNAGFPVLEPLLNWLLNHSLQAGVLVLLVLAIQWLFRRQLTNRWRFALWWLVLARLLLPSGPESAISVFNFVQPKVQMEMHYSPTSAQMAKPPQKNLEPSASISVSPAPSESVHSENNFAAAPAESASAPTEKTETAVAISKPAAVAPRRIPDFDAWNLREWDFDDFIIPGSMALWLAGVLVLGGVVVTQTIYFQRKLKRASTPADQNLRTLLDDCRREFGISRSIELLETDAVQSPALFGLFRLRLLLPRGIGGQFSPRELRYIFLHELAHVKRGDLWLNWLVTLLQIFHWFNPLLWFGFARLRADRELACDELALLRAGDQAGTAYGETVVKLLENLNRPAAIPGLVGILEDKKQMRRRIAMIANFRKPSRWSALAIFLIVGLAAAALTDAQTSKPVDSTVKNSASLVATNSEIRPDLIGIVSAKDGAQLPVSATVFIATAAPKSGTSTFCPSCYADCIKHSSTDAQGGFKIESLDPQLTFQILTVAKGFKPQYVSNVDPAKGAPVKIELEPIESADATPDRSLRGRVVDEKGAAIAGAVVEVQGIETRDGGGRWGSLPGIDPLAVTDDNGEFLITAQKPFDMLAVKVSARAFANKNFDRLASGTDRHDLVLSEGATLTGRVLLNGKPLAGISVGVSSTDRAMQHYLGHFEVGTGTNGNFTFLNLPPDADYYIYGIMDSLKNFGAIPIQTVHVGKDGETTDAGDLIVGLAHRLAGHVVLADGQPLPAKVRLLVSREQAWDSMQITLDKDGHFDTTGVPSELVNLSARVKGYHVSSRNLSVDQLNPFQLIGRMDLDTTNLVFMLEKGPDPIPNYQQIPPDYTETRQHSLRGAEGVPDHSRDWLVSGRAVDNETKRPVKNFTITPGQVMNFDQPAWNTFETVAGTDGTYQIHVGKRIAQPLLLAEADGYLPSVATVLPGDATNVDFILKRGVGPAGTILTPDGKPAAGATLVLLGDGFNEASFNSAGELATRGNQSAQQTADADGKFSFKPVWGKKYVAAASADGFASVSIESLTTNSVIKLEAYGEIIGTLKRTSGLGTNEDLDVAFDDGATLIALSRLNMSNHAVTDAQGHFEFHRVPPGHLRITYRVPMQNYGSWQNTPLQSVTLQPGQSLAININASDRSTNTEMSSYQPPPPPKLIPGVQIKGVVLLPDGQPAADADVALQVENEYLALGKGVFSSNNAREKGLIVSTAKDGSFTLPMYEKAQSVVALNEMGIVQVSLEQLKTSPQITLQKWGRIEGTLRVGHHVGANESIHISQTMPQWSRMKIQKSGQTNNFVSITNSSPTIIQLPFYDFNAFVAKTDDQGHFAITFVPPGKQTLSRMVPTGAGSSTSSQLAIVDVKPGETVVANAGGTGRTVIGMVKIADRSSIDFTNGYAIITTPMNVINEKAKQLKTDAEREAFYESPEVQKAYENYRGFSGLVAPDGSFRMEDVLPGTYEFNFQERFMPGAQMTSIKMFTSAQEITVPAAKDTNDDSVVDLGTIELKKLELPIPAAAKK